MTLVRQLDMMLVNAQLALLCKSISELRTHFTENPVIGVDVTLKNYQSIVLSPSQDQMLLVSLPWYVNHRRRSADMSLLSMSRVIREHMPNSL